MIRKTLIAALCVLFCSGTMRADDTVLGSGISGMFKPSASYTGPGDIASFTMWGGLRAYSAATRGTKAISLCDHLGANCADVLTNATTGKLNSPGTRGSDNCNSLTTCVVPTIYDQTASATNCTQATVANMATFNLTGGPGGNTPALVFNGSSTQYTCAVPGSGLPVSESTVAERTGAFTSFGTVVSYGNTNDLGFSTSANNAYGYAGSVLNAAATDSTWHGMQLLFPASGTGNLSIDGSSTTGSIGTGSPPLNSTIGHGVGGFFNGSFVEGGFFQGDLSASFTSLNSNQHTFWGF